MDSILVAEMVCQGFGIGYCAKSFRRETRFLFRLYTTLLSLSCPARHSRALLTLLFTCVQHVIRDLSYGLDNWIQTFLGEKGT